MAFELESGGFLTKILRLKKTKCWIWKAFCRDTRELVDWECGERDSHTFSKLYKRLKHWGVDVFFSDGWQTYKDIIPKKYLIQSKSETHLIESNNMPQRHWFARFRRKTCVVSRLKEMVDLTTILYARVHVNKNLHIII